MPLLPRAVRLFSFALPLLAGCSSAFNTATSPSPTRTPGSVTGTVHGGQQAISYATVKLYAAGTMGYGAGSTLLATTTTSGDGNGNFGFTQAASGTYANTGSTYVCPSGNPLIYLLSTGGNTQSTANDTAAFNPAATLFSVVGNCNSINSSTYVYLNEISTVQGVFLLAPYINPTTGAIGAPTNTQAQLGFANAVARLSNLIQNLTGAVGTPQTYTGTNASVAGVTVTATAEYSKIITMADILATCINSTNTAGNPSTTCQELLGAAIALSGTAPTDTLQAAYYMATNPADKGTVASACATNGFTSNISCLAFLAGGVVPFQPTLSSTPPDWTIGVTYTATGTCPGGGAFISGPAKTLIDASGDIWFLSGAASNANLAEISPLGKPLYCGGNMSNGRGLAMDPTGNIWAVWNSATSGGLFELPAGSTTLIAWPTTADITFIPYNVTSDISGNIFALQAERGELVYKYTTPGATTTPFNPTFYAGPLYANGVSVNPTPADSMIPSSTANVVYALPNALVPATIYPTITPKTIPCSGYYFYSTVDYYGNDQFTYTSTAPVSNDQLTMSGFTDPAMVGFNGTHITVGFVNTSSSYFRGSILNKTGSAVSQTADNGVGTTNPGSSFATGFSNIYGLALDANNAIYSVSNGGFSSSLRRPAHFLEGTPGSAGSGNSGTSGMGGITGGRSVALDGAGTLWIGNQFSATGNATATTNYPVSAVLYNNNTSTFTALSADGVTNLNTTTCSVGNGNGCPTQGGFYKTDIQQALDLAVDPSGAVWVMNTGPSTTATGVNGYNGTSITQILGPGTPTVTPLIQATISGTLATRP